MGLGSGSGIKFNEIGNALIETAYAEFGSAIEMIAASKKTKNIKLRTGYIKHAVDEYKHASIFCDLPEIEKHAGARVNFIPRFETSNLYRKGYLKKNKRLCDSMNEKKFIEFVYSNELLAKESFESLLKALKSNKSKELVREIMKDELRLHGLAKEYYLSRYSISNLKYAYRKEMLKNRLRLILTANRKFLDKIFHPLIIIFTYASVYTLKQVNIRKLTNKNIFEKSPTSIL